MKQTRFFITVFCLCAAAVMGGCYSVPKTIPEDLSAEELVQLAQSSFDAGNIKAAEVYYETIIKRYGNDINLLVEAEFEIAHLKVKQGKWEEAVPMLNRILSYYESDESGYLSAAYKKLVLIDLAKAPEHMLEKAVPPESEQPATESVAAEPAAAESAE